MGQTCQCQTSNSLDTTQYLQSQKSEKYSQVDGNVAHPSKPQGISEKPQQRYQSDEEDDVDIGDEAKKYTHRASFLLKLMQNERNGEIRIEFSQSASPTKRQQNQQFYEMIIKYQQEMQSYQKKVSKKSKREKNEKLSLKSCSPRKNSKYQQQQSKNSQADHINVMNQFNYYILQQKPAWVSPTKKRKPRGEMYTQIVQPQQITICESGSQVVRRGGRQFSTYHKNHHTAHQFSPRKSGILKKNSRSYSGYHQSEGSFNSTRKKKVHFSGFYPKQE